jgi:hypothetical protein
MLKMLCSGMALSYPTIIPGLRLNSLIWMKGGVSLARSESDAA